MISLSVNVQNPFSQKFQLYWSKCIKTISKNKFINFQLYRDSSLLAFNFDLSVRKCHTGIRAKIGAFGFCFESEFYDSRHWDNPLSREQFYELHDNCKG
jgi:hypothetical protein